ncbi:hypothetical protein [Shewanella atlantica]|uniref:hypothetical protein n=1 Tax=Shewanella atlantica TaxID=271099 RepID=UPI0037353F3A
MKIIQLLIVATLTLPFSLSADSENHEYEEQMVLASCMSLKKPSADISADSCIYYIQGFLAGSLNINTNYKFRETSGGFLDRAYNTRVGKQTSKKQLTQLCIPKDENFEDLAGRLVGHLSFPIDSMQLLHNQIYQALEVESLC